MQMKRIWNKPTTLLTVLFSWILIMTSCESELSNGDLDGMWRLDKIAYNNGDEIACSNLYYVIYHKLIELAWRPEDKRPGQEMNYYMGRFNHTGDSLYIHDFRYYRDEENKVTLDDLSRFGLQSEETRFQVVTLNRSHMTLKAPHATFYFRKF